LSRHYEATERQVRGKLGEERERKEKREKRKEESVISDS